ncbi:MAG: MerR family transcriptional regulator, partial [Balneolaceae bacterium]|nr:MerR family transcriptional regulator [Balneolaceae bacterium]
DQKHRTFKIGEVAKRCSVNKETVRYYERRDLIEKPERRRSGYRIFTRKHIEQITFIKRAQQLGFTLTEIQELLELRLNQVTACDEMRGKARQKLEDVRGKMDDLQRIESVLNDLITACESGGETEDCVILRSLEGKTETGKNLR